MSLTSISESLKECKKYKPNINNLSFHISSRTRINGFHKLPPPNIFGFVDKWLCARQSVFYSCSSRSVQEVTSGPKRPGSTNIKTKI